MIAYRAFGVPLLFTVDEWIDVVLLAVSHAPIDLHAGCAAWAAASLRGAW
jgi:hypothetical protein